MSTGAGEASSVKVTLTLPTALRALAEQYELRLSALLEGAVRDALREMGVETLPAAHTPRSGPDWRKRKRVAKPASGAG